MPALVKDIDVFILCGGMGKRLRRVCGRNPKPMVEFNGEPFLNVLIKHMSKFGFRRFILGIGYKAGVIKDYYSKKQMPGIRITFSRERSPLDTGGAVKNAKRLIKSSPFLVLNGDSFCSFDPLLFLRFHKRKKSLASILLIKSSNVKDFGRVGLAQDCRIANFCEKMPRAENGLINAGVYIFDRRIFSFMPHLSRFSLERDFFPPLVTEKMFGYRHRGLFFDIGTPQRYCWAKKIIAYTANN